VSFRVRRLAAIDMYGTRGTVRRRRLVLAEFLLGCLVSLALGGYVLWRGGLEGWLVGLWLIGIGANYLSLSIHALDLARSDRLSAEIAAIDDLAAQSRYYSIAQIRLFVPGLVAVRALTSIRRPVDGSR
jgi:hypothetical protein